MRNSLRIALVALCLAYPSTTLPDSPGVWQRITLTSQSGRLTLTVETDTRRPAKFPDLKTFIGLEPLVLQALIAGQLKECVWEFPEQSSSEAGQYKSATRSCK